MPVRPFFPIAILCIALFAVLIASDLYGSNEEDGDNILTRGRLLFQAACVPCHGSEGKGDGPISRTLQTKPTNMTRGIYHNRSTYAGKYPTDYDLYHTITNGLHYTAMPVFRQMTMEDRSAIVNYIKSLSTRFSDSNWYSPPDTMGYEGQIPPSPQSLLEGRRIYVLAACDRCHGIDGTGGLTYAMFDDEGNPRMAIDLTNPAVYKFSDGPNDIFRITMTAIDTRGLTREDQWNLANYVWSLRSADQFPSIK